MASCAHRLLLSLLPSFCHFVSSTHQPSTHSFVRIVFLESALTFPVSDVPEVVDNENPYRRKNSRETDWRPTLNTAVSRSPFCPLRHTG